MKQLFTLLLLISCLLAQENITVYINQAENKFNRFEKELIQEIIRLHTIKSSKKYNLEFRKYAVFNKLFELLDKEKNSSSIIGINSISITKERAQKYHFSPPYFVSKIILLSKKHKKIDINQNTRISYTSGTLNLRVIELLKKKHVFKIVPYNNYNNRYKALMEMTDDYGVGDYVDSWIYDMNILKIFNEFGQDHYGIIFPKNSSFAKVLDKTIAYYVKSPAYYKLIRKHFGKNAAYYVKQNL